MADTQRPILVFDSGLGGLTVLRAVRAALPGRRVIYVADDAAFPYGDWPAQTLCARLVELFSELLARYQPAIVVLGCNTASTLALSDLRSAYPHTPFVGTVPAIKPAAQRSRSGVIALLSTPATASQRYTRELIDQFAVECHVERVGSPLLARLAEAHMQGDTVADADILGEISPCFVAHGSRRTDVVVLACTHYPLLADNLRRLAPWPVMWLDPAEAIARRVQALVAEDVAEGPASDRVEPDRAVFTRGIPKDSIRRLMANEGLVFQ